MFAYHVRLALLSLRQTPVLTALMIGLIALGVGMSMTTLTIFYLMSGNPMAFKNDRLYNVRLDSWEADEPWDDDRPAEPPYQLTYIDAQALRLIDGPVRRAAMFKGVFTIAPEDPEVKPFIAVSRMTDGDFFAMFEPQFKYGGPWDESADAAGQAVVVLSEHVNEDVFGGENSVGRTLRMDDRYFTVVGVLEHWAPTPKFYDMNNGAFDDIEDVFMPYSIVEQGQLQRTGNTNCWGSDQVSGWEQFLYSKCVWIQFWVEVESSDRLEAYRNDLAVYVSEQKHSGASSGR